MAELEKKDGRPCRGRRPWQLRLPGDDFYCLRYGVWYPSLDCAFRTKYQTSPGCARCDQGVFNLKRHHEALRERRLPVLREATDCP
jgi:hypothetical protein